MKFAIYVILTCVSLSAVCAGQESKPSDDYGTGNWLQRECAGLDVSKGSFGNGLCVGYIIGATRAFELVEVLHIPAQVENGQLVKIVHRYLNDNPEKLHHTAESLVFHALHDAFPPSSTPAAKDK